MSADVLMLNGVRVDYEEYDAYGFFYADDKVEFSYPGMSHSTIRDVNANRERGRIWTDSKIISFWKYNFSDIEDSYPEVNHHDLKITNKLTFREMLKFISDEFNKTHDLKININDEWLIDVPIKWTDGDVKPKFIYNYYKNQYAVVTLKDFEQGIIIDDESLGQAEIIHNLDVKDKEDYYKKHGKPKGWGSDLKIKKNPLDWEQAKRTSENMNIKNWQSFNESTNGKIKMIIEEEDLDYFDENDDLIGLLENGTIELYGETLMYDPNNDEVIEILNQYFDI